MEDIQRAYLPAAGRHWALPFYDPLVKLIGMDTTRRELLAQADVQGNHRVLDIGCGTGTFATLLKRLHPGSAVVGLDPDPKALARGRRKAERAAVSVQFDEGFSDELPYPDASFDRAFSSFMLHHLGADERLKTLSEVSRVLRPAGSFHMVDFSRPEAHAKSSLMRLLHSSHRLEGNSEDQILTELARAGFVHPKKVMEGSILLGLRIAYYQASVAPPEAAF
ncbi:MAG: class I SAM-dependent methyltransferase [Bryobacteraceae bacterium]